MKSTIALVFDQCFSLKLEEISEKYVVWICDSTENKSAASKIWQQHPERSVTTFQLSGNEDIETLCAITLSDIALHHSEWRVIHVYGLPFNEAMISIYKRSLEEAFEEELLSLNFQPTPLGFTIVR